MRSAFSAAAALALAASSALARPPSVLVILLDDLGYANTSPFRDDSDEEVVTPNIQALADEGRVLSRAYAYSWCTPTRSSLISGRLPIHVYQGGNAGAPSAWNASNPDFAGSGIPRNMTTLPYFARSLGYRSAMLGKWDAGFASMLQTPEARGFEAAVVYSHHAVNYSHPYNATDPAQALGGECGGQITDLWADGQPMRSALNTSVWVDDIFANLAIQYLSGSQQPTSQPAFVLWTPHVAHAPLQPPQRWLDKLSFIPDETRRKYHAMVGAVDELIGRVVASLKTSGMWNETVVMLFSDNGGPVLQCKPWDIDSTYCGGANNYPLKGGKISFWEGGVRVPGIISGGALPEAVRGTKAAGLFHVADVLNTFRSIAGDDSAAVDPVAQQAGLAPIDSVSQWAYLNGSTATPPRTNVTLSTSAYIDGAYKLLTGKQTSAFWTGPRYPNASTPNNGTGIAPDTITQDCGDSGCLFDLLADPTEHNDLASSMPAKAAAMLSALQAEAKTLSPDPSVRGDPQAEACAAAGQAGGFWVPFVDTHWTAQDALDWLDTEHAASD